MRQVLLAAMHGVHLDGLGCRGCKGSWERTQSWDFAARRPRARTTSLALPGVHPIAVSLHAAAAAPGTATQLVPADGRCSRRCAAQQQQQAGVQAGQAVQADGRPPRMAACWVASFAGRWVEEQVLIIQLISSIVSAANRKHATSARRCSPGRGHQRCIKQDRQCKLHR